MPTSPSFTKLLLVVMVLAPCFSSNTSAAAEPRERFALDRGSDAVCVRFARVLNRMNGDQLPGCNRTEPDPAPRFEQLVRKKLPAEELYKISESLLGFAEHGAANHYGKLRRETIDWCARNINPTRCTQNFSDRDSEISHGGRWLETYGRSHFDASNAWTYSPEVDIDNDGIADPVLLLTLARCGGENYKGALEKSQTYAFVMNRKYLGVDEMKTRATFGHPDPNWPASVESDRFRYIGTNLGVFKFRGRTFFYSLMNSFADLDGKRVLDPSLESTVGVFIRERGVTRDVCEYRDRNVRGQGIR
jgi:hypothetical protein